VGLAQLGRAFGHPLLQAGVEHRSSFCTWVSLLQAIALAPSWRRSAACRTVRRSSVSSQGLWM
jgi:hypothetical protein